MKAVLPISRALRINKGPFSIKIIHPGKALLNPDDPTGLAQLGRFDFAHLKPGTFVAMHQHRNDEILSYLREGSMIHEDSSGTVEEINNTYLMMMNAGSGFYHQEHVPGDAADVRMLQIFIRPEHENDDPAVQFHRLESTYSLNNWRLIAGHPSLEAGLIVKSHAAVYDMRLTAGAMKLPDQPGKTYLLFIFSGEAEVDDGTLLQEGDSLIYTNEELHVNASGVADLVLFELDPSKQYTRSGMFSGG